MHRESQAIGETKEASIRRILLRFNDTQDMLRVVIDEEAKVLMVVDKSDIVPLAIPMYMLTNSEVFKLVHSYITNKLAESKVLN